MKSLRDDKEILGIILISSIRLTTYRLTRELTQMQAHQNRHGTLPTGESLSKIQEQSRLETQKISEKILIGDAMLGLPDYDLLGPGAFLIQGDKELLRTFLMAYGYSPDMMTNKLSQKLMGLMLLHQYSNLSIQVRIDNWQDKVKSLKDLEKLMWGEF